VLGASGSTPANIAVAKRFLTEEELAQLTGISVRTLQKWRIFARGPRFKKLGGKAVRYDRGDIDEWLASCPSGGGGAT
jgi:excisionase family DNA binding protein